jgi:beta-lactamase class A
MKSNRFGFVILGLILGIAGGYLVAKKTDEKIFSEAISGVRSVRANDPSYKYINPLLAFEQPESTQFGEYKELDNKLTDLINRKKDAKLVDDVSVYFRGNQGRWVGINDSDQYYPASLLKVAVMIAYFQEAETNPDLLNKQLQYNLTIQQQATSSEYSTTSNLTLGKNYSVNDLINDMIAHSDNGATYMLMSSLDPKLLNEVFTDLGLKSPGNSPNYQISAKNYAFFFRVLYNATYLNRDYSEKALNLLAQSDFKNGLVGGLPQGTTIAHKYGEHVLTDSSGNPNGVELHDCGLIYGKNDFLLCVMTRGQKVEDLQQTIKDIASLVYAESGKQ